MPGEDRKSKTEKPTARRKKDARNEGQVAKTPELVTWLVVLVGTYLVQYTFRSTYALCEKLLYEVGNAMSHPSLATDFSVARSGATGALVALAPAVVGLMLVALVVNLAQTRGVLTLKPLKPSFARHQPQDRAEEDLQHPLALGGLQADRTGIRAEPHRLAEPRRAVAGSDSPWAALEHGRRLARGCTGPQTGTRSRRDRPGAGRARLRVPVPQSFADHEDDPRGSQGRGQADRRATPLPAPTCAGASACCPATG